MGVGLPLGECEGGGMTIGDAEGENREEGGMGWDGMGWGNCLFGFLLCVRLRVEG